MKHMNKFFATLAVILFVTACEQYELPEIQAPAMGTAKFDNIIAVGNSVAAGFMNGALYVDGQKNSFPSLIAAQMAQAGGGTFKQPDLPAEAVNGCYDPATGCTLGRLYLKLVGGSPTPTPKTPGNIQALAPYSGALNNFSVPGATIQTALTPLLGGPMVLPGPAANPVYNPYYARFASKPGTSTLIGDAATAMANGGTFFLLELGINDALGYAIGGASNLTLLTPRNTFFTAFNGALNALLSANPAARGAVANIPDVTELPYFTTITYNPVPLDAATQTALSAGFAGYNAALDGLIGFKALLGISDALAAEIASRIVTFAVSKTNKLLITDETLTDLKPYFDILAAQSIINSAQRAALEPYRQVRQSRPTDLIVLPAATVIGKVIGGNPTLINGVTLPLGFGENGTSDKYVLIPSEVSEIQARIAEFNFIIADAVNGKTKNLNTPNEIPTLALVDIYTAMKNLKKGTAVFKGSSLTSSIAPPFGVFSLDGLHPNARGNGYIANLFIQSINKTFGSTVPVVEINGLPGNEFPIP